MRPRFGTVLVGVGAAALTLLGMPAMTATASATTPFRATVPVARTPTTVRFVGTTNFVGTETATGKTLVNSGAHALPTNLSTVQTPVVHDVGKGDSVGGRPTPHGKGRGHVATTHASTSQTVTTTAGGATSQLGIDGYDQGLLNPMYTHTGLPGLDVEPSDQGLCSNGTYTVELNNSVMQVFNQAMNPQSRHGMALENLFDTPETAGATRPTGTVNVQGDPRCQWDPTSGRWFATELWLTLSGFKSTRNKQFGWAGVLVAVSKTADPTGTWNVFFVPDMNNLTTSTGCNNQSYTTLPFVTRGGTANPCFGDQPLLGVNGNSVFLSTNEYSTFFTAPYQVANVYFLDKADLTTYTTTAGTPSPIWWAHPGTSVPRDTAKHITTTTTQRAWWSIVPAVSDGTYPASTTFYAMSNVTYRTFTGAAGGTKVALWAFDTANVTTASTSLTGSMVVTTTTGVSYDNPPFAVQKAGTTPLGTLWPRLAGKGHSHRRPFGTEGPIQTNTDRITTAAYDPATGTVWGAMNTGVTGTARAGIAWFSVTPTGSASSLRATSVRAGYVSPSTADVMYPSIAFTTTGTGIMDMSLSGSDYYPSTAYALVTGTSASATPVTSTIHVSFAGVGPQDGFTEYTATYDTPRWGDYSTAVASGTAFYFASEAIGQSCSVTQFKTTFTCGGTRDLFINWGTSVNTLTA